MLLIGLINSIITLKTNMLRAFFPFPSCALLMILYSFHLKQGITPESEAFQLQCIKILVLQNQKLLALLVGQGAVQDMATGLCSCLGLTHLAQSSREEWYFHLFLINLYHKYILNFYYRNCIIDAVLNEQGISKR